MSDKLPEPYEGAVFYEDERLYSCLANQPRAKGHSIVAWKENISDLHLLSKEQYEHLMSTVEKVREVLMETLNVEKVYLIYMDEAEHVHWHLVPRYNEKGYDVLEHDPGKLEDTSLAREIEKELNFGD